MRALGEATRGLPKGMQLSPARAEALLRGFLNTWAGYGLTLADAAFFDDAPELRIDQYPALRRFYRKTPATHTRYVTEFLRPARGGHRGPADDAAHGARLPPRPRRRDRAHRA